MPEPRGSQTIPLLLNLPADVAQRLKQAADLQKRPAADMALDLLDRYLPRLASGDPKKGKIPYA